MTDEQIQKRAEDIAYTNSTGSGYGRDALKEAIAAALRETRAEAYRQGAIDALEAASFAADHQEGGSGELGIHILNLWSTKLRYKLSEPESKGNS